MAKEKEKEAEKEKAEAASKDSKEGEKAEGEEGEEGLNPPKKKLDKNIIILIVAIVIALAGLGGGAAFFFLGSAKHDAPTEEPAAEGSEAAAPKPSKPAKAEKSGHGEKAKKEGEGAAGAETNGNFFPLGDLLVNLSGEGKRPNYLKVKISLELADEADAPALEAVKPRIIDNFQVYLRELRVEDLRGSAGLYRLREALLLRVTEAVQPIRIRDVLFQEMLVQ